MPRLYLCLRLYYPLIASLALAGPVLAQSSEGDAVKGRSIVANRQVGLCLLCHSAPIAEERFQGDIAPSLEGAGSRWSRDELRQRIANARTVNPLGIMPSYGQVDGLHRVAHLHVARPLLTPAQIEDVVAYLVTLK
jgi:L-cysteine S-thiosulfotransferase